MVHKKYITIKGKKYGPYYYESYREDGKVKKRYVGSGVKEKGFEKSFKLGGPFVVGYLILVSLLVLGSLFFFFVPDDKLRVLFGGPEFLLAPPSAAIGTNVPIGDENVATWSDTDSGTYTSVDFVNFYAEFARESDGSFISYTDGGVCNIRFNYDGTLKEFSMTYDDINGYWVYGEIIDHKSPPPKNTHDFEVECTLGAGVPVNVINQFVITNTDPVYLTGIPTSFVGEEDTPLVVDFRALVYDPDMNEGELSFIINDIDGPLYGAVSDVGVAQYDWISIDSATGILTFDATLDEQSTTAGKKHDVNVFVFDLNGDGVSKGFQFDIAPRNDPPDFVDLVNESFNTTFLFEKSYDVTDEEGNVPLVINDLEFVDCDLAAWSTRTDCNLLVKNVDYSIDTDLGVIDISFTPDENNPNRDDVGDYFIKFSAMDSLGAYGEKIVNFSVRNINRPPEFVLPICDDLTSAVEDVPFSCSFIVDDPDEVVGVTFTSDKTWFLDNVFEIGDFNNPIATLVNFIPDDKSVGDWDIEVVAIDSGDPALNDTQIFPFSVSNVNDPVAINPILDFMVYTSDISPSFIMEVVDDDLFIQDKSVYDESFIYLTDNACVNVVGVGSVFDSNIFEAKVSVDPSCLGVGITSVMLTVTDLGGLQASASFNVDVSPNSAPIWNVVDPNYNLIEDVNVPLPIDLMTMVSDADVGDDIDFVYYFEDDVPFDDFVLDFETGMIDFIPSDVDVGIHNIVINATDGKAQVPYTFIFTVSNVNDAPVLSRPLQENGALSIDIDSNVVIEEDSLTELFLFLNDDDLRVPIEQSSFFEETLAVELSVTPDLDILSFGRDITVLTSTVPDNALYRTELTPKKSDVGSYDVSIGIRDLAGDVDVLDFVLTINEIDHHPIFENLNNLSGAVGRTLIYDINSSDVEDGNESLGETGFVYSYVMLEGGSDILAGSFDTATGEINKQFVAGDEGVYRIEFTVSDSGNFDGTPRTTTKDVYLYVYETPIILSPIAGKIFQTTEGTNLSINFTATNIFRNDLIYEFYLHNISRGEYRVLGDGSKFAWNFTSEYTDETYGGFGELKLVAMIPDVRDVNASRTWKINILHSNAPMSFNDSNPIGDKETVLGGTIVIDLKKYFSDADAFDVNYNQSVKFDVFSNSASSVISWDIDYTDWTLSLSSGEIVNEILNLSGTDFLTRDFSNNFEVKFMENNVPPPPVVVHVPVDVPVDKPVSLKLLLPGPVSARKGDTLTLPITLFNDGSKGLKGINLTTLIVKDGVFEGGFNAHFDDSYFEGLSPGAKVNTTLTVEIGAEDFGVYELNINATVKNPKYVDWSKIYISVEEGETVVEKLVFTEEFIVSNPECAEIKELLDESRALVLNGNYDLAESKLKEALDACKEAISQQSLFSKSRFSEKLQNSIFVYLLIATIMAILLGVGYYAYKTVIFKRALKMSEKIKFGGLKEGSGRIGLQKFN